MFRLPIWFRMKVTMTLKRIFLLIGIIISLIIIVVPLTILFLLQPVGGTRQTITIPEGTGLRGVAQLLQEKNIIRSEYAFLIASKVSNRTVMAGTYELDPTKSTLDILTDLSKSKDERIVITIPEGWRREQIAEKLNEKNLDGTKFLELTTDKEGYLFPDTYFFPKDATAEQIVDRFTQNFKIRTQQLIPTREQLILASIVEREAQKETDRTLIAGIYANRINKNMALEADPTVQYARDTNILRSGKTLEFFWQPITLANYKNVISPYNTYLQKSYPPGPICNPGLKSIEAAINPKTTDAIYFIHTRDGRTFTSTTLEGHRENVRKYLQ